MSIGNAAQYATAIGRLTGPPAINNYGQKSAWQPEGSALLYWSWALTVTGWVLTTAVAAGLTGLLKRD